MSLKDVRLGQLLRVHLDGIPLDLASSLLPLRSRRRLSLLLHLHLHARSQKRFEGRSVKVARGKVSRQALLGLIDSLEAGDQKTSLAPFGNGMGGLLRGYQLFPRRPRRQAAGRPGFHKRSPAADRLGSWREYRDLQPHRRGRRESHRLLRHRPGLRRNQLSPKPPGKGNEPPPPPPRRDQSEPWRRLGERRTDDALRARPGRRGSRPRPHPPSGHRQQRPSG